MTCSVINKSGDEQATLIAYYIDYTWIDYDTIILCCYFRELFVSYIYYDVVSIRNFFSLFIIDGTVVIEKLDIVTWLRFLASAVVYPLRVRCSVISNAVAINKTISGFYVYFFLLVCVFRTDISFLSMKLWKFFHND